MAAAAGGGGSWAISAGSIAGRSPAAPADHPCRRYECALSSKPSFKSDVVAACAGAAGACTQQVDCNSRSAGCEQTCNCAPLHGRRPRKTRTTEHPDRPPCLSEPKAVTLHDDDRSLHHNSPSGAAGRAPAGSPQPGCALHSSARTRGPGRGAPRVPAASAATPPGELCRRRRCRLPRWCRLLPASLVVLLNVRSPSIPLQCRPGEQPRPAAAVTRCQLPLPQHRRPAGHATLSSTTFVCASPMEPCCWQEAWWRNCVAGASRRW